MFDFQDQVALVTGASRGIGREVARQLAQRGAKLAVASRSAQAIRECAQELASLGGQALPLVMDVGDPQQVREALQQVWEEFEQLHILVNNAAITRDNLLLRLKEEDWREVMGTNLDGVFFVTKEVAARMLRQRYGRIVNISSVVAQMGNAGQTNYVAAKAGLIGFTKALARELAPRNITVNAVAPGFVETDMTSRLPEKARQELLSQIPLGRIGQVQDVAWGVLFLAAKESGYITGHVLNINGGLYM